MRVHAELDDGATRPEQDQQIREMAGLLINRDPWHARLELTRYTRKYTPQTQRT